MRRLLLMLIAAVTLLGLMSVNTTCSHATEKVYHSAATLEAEARGIEYVDGFMIWADTHEEIEPDAEGFMPYEEFYLMDDPEADRDMIWMYYDDQIGKALHDKYCGDSHQTKLCKKHKKCKKCKKLGKRCKSHKKCKKCKRLQR